MPFSSTPTATCSRTPPAPHRAAGGGHTFVVSSREPTRTLDMLPRFAPSPPHTRPYLFPRHLSLPPATPRSPPTPGALPPRNAPKSPTGPPQLPPLSPSSFPSLPPTSPPPPSLPHHTPYPYPTTSPSHSHLYSLFCTHSSHKTPFLAPPLPRPSSSSSSTHRDLTLHTGQTPPASPHPLSPSPHHNLIPPAVTTSSYRTP